MPNDRDVVLLADDAGRIERARKALALIGIDRVVASAGAAVRDAWRAAVGPLEQVQHLDVDALASSSERTIVDVRNQAEWSQGHLPAAEHLFLGELADHLRDLPRDEPIALHCGGGTRSAIAASILQAAGFKNVANVTGGFRAWQDAGFPVVHDDPAA